VEREDMEKEVRVMNLPIQKEMFSREIILFSLFKGIISLR